LRANGLRDSLFLDEFLGRLSSPGDYFSQGGSRGRTLCTFTICIFTICIFINIFAWVWWEHSEFKLTSYALLLLILPPRPPASTPCIDPPDTRMSKRLLGGIYSSSPPAPKTPQPHKITSKHQSTPKTTNKKQTQPPNKKQNTKAPPKQQTKQINTTNTKQHIHQTCCFLSY